MRLMLHACCGPCALEPTRILSGEGAELAIDYSNPNIHPQAEYHRRLETLRTAVCEPQGLALHEGCYDPQEWERRVGVYGADRAGRCRACYRMRLERAAARAAEEGFDALSTTLTISPYQFTDVILEELERAAAAHGLVPVCRDFRERYPEATRRSKELGMYRQNYCGCRFSIAEAAAERAERARERETAKRVKHEALIWAAANGAVNQVSQL